MPTSLISNARHKIKIKINRPAKINWKDDPVMAFCSTGNHTVTNVQIKASVTIFKMPKSFILFLCLKGRTGTEYKRVMMPDTNNNIK